MEPLHGPGSGSGGNLFVRARRPPSYWDVVGNHLPLALLTGAILLFAVFQPYVGQAIKACTFLRLTGYPCPFCGVSRGLAALVSGDWSGAAVSCPLAYLVFILVALVFLWNSAALLLGVTLERGRWLRLSNKKTRWILAGSVVLLLAANWIYRLSSGLK